MADRIYALQNLSCFFNITPKDFWNYTYKEINMYCNMQTIRYIEDFKRLILLNEATTNKLIQADAMSNAKPKILLIKDQFKELFKNNVK